LFFLLLSNLLRCATKRRIGQDGGNITREQHLWRKIGGGTEEGQERLLVTLFFDD